MKIDFENSRPQPAGSTWARAQDILILQALKDEDGNRTSAANDWE